MASVIENTAPEAYRQRVEETILQVATRHTGLENVTIRILGMRAMPGFLVRIDDARGFAGAGIFRGPDDDVADTLCRLLCEVGSDTKRPRVTGLRGVRSRRPGAGDAGVAEG